MTDQPCSYIDSSILTTLTITNDVNDLIIYDNISYDDNNFNKMSTEFNQSCFIKCELLDAINYDMIIDREDIYNLLSLINEL